jgi:hypothetical protein
MSNLQHDVYQVFGREAGEELLERAFCVTEDDDQGFEEVSVYGGHLPNSRIIDIELEDYRLIIYVDDQGGSEIQAFGLLSVIKPHSPPKWRKSSAWGPEARKRSAQRKAERQAAKEEALRQAKAADLERRLQTLAEMSALMRRFGF